MIRRRLGALKARISGDRSPAGDPPTPAPTAARPARAAEAADPGPAESWLLTDEPHRVRLRVEGGRRLLPAEDLAAFTPWHVEPRGLCSGDECVPWPGGSQDRDLSEVDLDEFSELTGTPLASEPIGDGGFAIAMGRAARRWPLADRLDAPEVTLPDLDGRPRRLSEWSGRKRVLLVFASWCGCRDDLPAWQQVIDGLGGTGDWAFVAIAADESPEQVRPLVGPFREPVLHDPDRHFCEAYGVIHVPTVIWVDEHDRVVRPNDLVFADDRLREHTGLDSSVHHEALRRWLSGEEAVDEDEVRARQMAPTQEEQLARAEFRLAVWLLRRGEEEAARRHLDAAGRLSPEDFTIRRAGIQLTGGDPFGEEFAALAEDWMAHSGGRYYRPRPPVAG